MEKSLEEYNSFARIANFVLQVLTVVIFAALVLFVLVKLSFVVLPLSFAIILASALSPLVTFLTNKGVPRNFASVSIVLFLVSSVGGILYFITATLWRNREALVASGINAYQQTIETLYSTDSPVPREVVDPLVRSVQKITDSALTSDLILQATSFLLTGLAETLLTLVLLGFFLKDGAAIFQFVVEFLPHRLRSFSYEAGMDAIKTLGGYIRGTTIIAIINSVLIGVCLGFMHVPFALPLSLLVFLGVFIPYVGGTSTGIIITVIAIATTGMPSGILVGIVVMIVNQIEGYVLAPYILGKQLNMHPLAVLLTLTTGGIIGGIVGALLAMPVAVSLWSARKVWINKYEDKESSS